MLIKKTVRQYSKYKLTYTLTSEKDDSKTGQSVFCIFIRKDSEVRTENAHMIIPFDIKFAAHVFNMLYRGGVFPGSLREIAEDFGFEAG